MDLDSKTFEVQMTIWKQEDIVVNPVRKAEIKTQSKAKVGALIFNKAPIEVPREYCNYNNVFSAKNAAEFRKNFGINEHAIYLKKDKQ